MNASRRQFIQAAGTTGAALFTLRTTLAGNRQDRGTVHDNERPSFVTEMFLDNEMLEATPGVSRRLHPAKKHLLNPVVRADRWCEGTYIEPYTTMYDAEEKLFKLWARAGSDAKAGYVGGNAAWMLYYTSKDGVHWEKPDLKVCEVAGRATTTSSLPAIWSRSLQRGWCTGRRSSSSHRDRRHHKARRRSSGESTSILGRAIRLRRTSLWRLCRITAAVLTL